MRHANCKPCMPAHACIRGVQCAPAGGEAMNERTLLRVHHPPHLMLRCEGSNHALLSILYQCHRISKCPASSSMPECVRQRVRLCSCTCVGWQPGRGGAARMPNIWCWPSPAVAAAGRHEDVLHGHSILGECELAANACETMQPLQGGPRRRGIGDARRSAAGRPAAGQHQRSTRQHIHLEGCEVVGLQWANAGGVVHDQC